MFTAFPETFVDMFPYNIVTARHQLENDRDLLSVMSVALVVILYIKQVTLLSRNLMVPLNHSNVVLFSSLSTVNNVIASHVVSLS